MIIVIFILFALLFLKVTLIVRYDGRTSAWIKILFIRIRLKKKKTNSNKSRNTGLPKLLIRSFEGLRKWSTVEYLDVDFISAGEDPYEAVMRYNMVDLLLYSLLELFNIKKYSINTDIDTEADESTLVFGFGISMRALHILHLLFRSILEVHNGKQTERNDAVGNERHTAAG